ncbi:MAG: hypothetical protein WC352_04210 [Candidatus Omnitrophota bacterium]
MKQTEIVRPRIQPLQTFDKTLLPYIFLAESAVNAGDTVVRKGEVTVEKPSLLLPPNLPLFEGFESDHASKSDLDTLADFLLVRGVRFPSMNYHNKTESVDVREGKLGEAVGHYERELQRAENVSTGLVIGPEDCWPFSVMVYIGSAVLRSAENDIRRLWERYREEH